jgi:hypothetical protein
VIKFLFYLVATLTILVGFFCLSCTNDEQNTQNIELKVRVRNMIDKSIVPYLNLEVVNIENNKIVATAETNGDGIAIFKIPEGKYHCQVPKNIDWTGGIDVDLRNTTEVIIEVISKQSR